MRRSDVNLLLDVISLIVFLTMIWTGCLMYYVLPTGGGQGHTLTLWDIYRHDYGKVHFFLALAYGRPDYRTPLTTLVFDLFHN